MAHVLATLIESLEQDQHYLNLDCKPQIESFLEKARCFRDFLLNCSFISEDLEKRIRDATQRAEDLVEIHITNQVLAGQPYKPSVYHDGVPQLDLTYLVEELESIKEKILYSVDDREIQSYLPIDNSPPDVPSLLKLFPGRKNYVPILEDDFRILKERLIGEPSKLQIIPIIGKPGAGKRTLAQRLYNDIEIVNHFDACAWTALSHENDQERPLRILLEGLGKLTYEMRGQNAAQLGVHLRNALEYKKYFLVFDTVRCEASWGKFRRFLPSEKGIGSRVLFTTCYKNVANYSNSMFHKIGRLKENDCQLLFCQKVFGQNHFPEELKPYGDIIIGLCKGLPLTISLIAGILAASEKNPEFWNLVLRTMSSSFENACDATLPRSVLRMCYDQLPYYLKPCLLDMHNCLEQFDSKASFIIKRWIAHGFIKQIPNMSLEDLAEVYLKTLINRSLVVLSQKDSMGKVKTFTIHWLVKHFCWSRAAVETNRVFGPDNRLVIRDVCDDKDLDPCHVDAEFSLARSFIFLGPVGPQQSRSFLRWRLLKVLDVFEFELYQFPTELMLLVLLRYLALCCHSRLPTSLASLQNLQILILRRLPSIRVFTLPYDLWGMTQLTHVKCKETFMWLFRKGMKIVIHWKLQALSNMQMFGVTDELLEWIPNLRKLGIVCNIEMHTVFDLACLQKLETLKCSSDWSLASRNFLSYLTLPLALKKLTLRLCRIPCGFMNVIGSLPNLEQLKLQKSDFLGEKEWELTEGEFPQLVSLMMADLDLVRWTWKAHTINFPKLRHLVVRHCCSMAEIPLAIGDVQTIELIEVNKTNPSVVASALQIKEQQEGRGNKILQVNVTRA